MEPGDTSSLDVDGQKLKAQEAVFLNKRETSPRLYLGDCLLRGFLPKVREALEREHDSGQPEFDLWHPVWSTLALPGVIAECLEKPLFTARCDSEINKLKK